MSNLEAWKKAGAHLPAPGGATRRVPP
jgi:hypothetical protein